MTCLLCGFVTCTTVSVGSDDSLACCIKHLFLKPAAWWEVVKKWKCAVIFITFIRDTHLCYQINCGVYSVQQYAVINETGDLGGMYMLYQLLIFIKLISHSEVKHIVLLNSNKVGKQVHWHVSLKETFWSGCWVDLHPHIQLFPVGWLHFLPLLSRADTYILMVLLC